MPPPAPAVNGHLLQTDTFTMYQLLCHVNVPVPADTCLTRRADRAIFDFVPGMKRTVVIAVEPLSNDHPHQRPSLLYDHISCDRQCFLFVRSLANDHPSDATSGRVRWNVLPRERPHRVFQNDCGMNVR